ncbi:MAG: mannitol dehydrogenase family protein [Hungatella sp.]
MNLTDLGLKDKKQWEDAGIAVPSYDRAAAREKTKANPIWVHFGAGNIFRGFIANLQDALLEQGIEEKGIIAVETFDFDIIDQIYKPFDDLALLITLKADGSTQKQVIASLMEGMKADAKDAAQWNRLKEIFVNPSLQMISFTITEKGYALKGSDGSYFPFVKADIERGPSAPGCAMAVVCALLHERYLAGAQPLAVVSMDNCSHNGEKLQTSIVTMAKEWAAKGYVEEGFLAYLSDEQKVSFPWSMIDKITPRPSVDLAAELEASGVANMQPVITSKKTYIAPFVNAEGPQYLVVEDKFPAGRPAFEKAGVYMTDRDTVNKVERMKVTTCLNPLHTALAVYGCILGYESISAEMQDAQLKKLVEEIGLTEGMPVVTDPKILSPETFVDEVIHDRLPNPFIPDAPQRIACDTSQKVGIRYGETIKSYVAQYGDAKKLIFIPLAIAGWCRYLLGVDDQLNTFELSGDPMIPELKELLKGIEVGKPETYTGQLKPILSNSNIFGVDLYAAGIGDLIEDMFVKEIEGAGAVRETLKSYLV